MQKDQQSSLMAEAQPSLVVPPCIPPSPRLTCDFLLPLIIFNCECNLVLRDTHEAKAFLSISAMGNHLITYSNKKLTCFPQEVSFDPTARALLIVLSDLLVARLIAQIEQHKHRINKR